MHNIVPQDGDQSSMTESIMLAQHDKRLTQLKVRMFVIVEFLAKEKKITHYSGTGDFEVSYLRMKENE